MVAAPRSRDYGGGFFMAFARLPPPMGESPFVVVLMSHAHFFYSFFVVVPVFFHYFRGR